MTSAKPHNWSAISPWLGIVPRSTKGRIFFFWASCNVLLTLTPVFTTWLDSTQVLLGVAPTVLFVSFIAFFSNCALGTAYYIVRARPWAKTAD